MQQVQLKDVKRGDFIKRKADASKIYRRGEYCRDEKRFECGDWEDISRAIYLKGSTLVWVGFDF